MVTEVKGQMSLEEFGWYAGPGFFKNTQQAICTEADIINSDKSKLVNWITIVFHFSHSK
jgi:hypothetical protein